MKGVTAILGLLVTLGIGYFVYQQYMVRGSAGTPPQEQIDVVGIRAELLTIGKAEGQYLVTHSTYGTLDQLRADDLLTGGVDQRGYTFTVAADGNQGFTATASPADPGKTGWPTLSIDSSMQVTER